MLSVIVAVLAAVTVALPATAASAAAATSVASATATATATATANSASASATASVSAGAAGITGAPAITGPSLGAVGQGISFDRKGDPWKGSNYVSYRLAPVGDGSFYLVYSTRCVTAGGFEDAIELTTLPGCSGMESQKFYFVPANHTPALKATDGQTNNEYFYIVGVERQKCLQSSYGGMNYTGGENQIPLTATCAENEPKQLFTIHNDRRSSSGVNLEWQNVLNLALQYGSTRCGRVSSACLVSPDGISPAGTTLQTDDDAIVGFGTIGTQLLGCGSPSGDGSEPTFTNMTQDLAHKTIGSSQSFTTSNETSDSLGGEISAEYEGGTKDIWSMKVTGKVMYDHTWVDIQSATKERSSSLGTDVRPGYTAMSNWAAETYTIAGGWYLARDLPTTGGTLRWSIHATSSYPVITSSDGAGNWIIYTTQTKKSCVAGPAATLDANVAANLPVLTSDLSTCPAYPDTSATVAAPTGTVGSTVYVCPGNWVVPSLSPGQPAFDYRWYVRAGQSAPKQYVSTATSYRIQTSTTSGTTGDLYLGVDLADLGPSNRLESVYHGNSNDLTLVRPGAGAEVYDATTFVGRLAEQQVGTPFSTSVVDHAGTGIAAQLAVGSSLPAGVALSADGVLSGTPAEAGTFSFDVVSASGGEPTTLTLIVHPESATFSADAALTATVGEPVSAALVTDAPAGLELELRSGALPAGVSIDPVTGVLSGTPEMAGAYRFAIGAAGSLDAGGAYTLTVSELATSLVSGTLAEARVGTAFSATVASVVGTGALIGLDGEGEVLPAGLDLDPTTGVLNGTPTEAGSYTVQIADLTDLGNRSTVTLVVVAAGEGTSTLAATGATVSAAFGAAGLLLVAGGVLLALLVLRRKRRDGHGTL